MTELVDETSALARQNAQMALLVVSGSPIATDCLDRLEVFAQYISAAARAATTELRRRYDYMTMLRRLRTQSHVPNLSGAINLAG